MELSKYQLEILELVKSVNSEEDVSEIKSLLKFYFRDKLEKAIDQVEKERNYTAATYKKWLESSNKTI